MPDNTAWSYNSSIENDIPWFGTHNGPSKVREEFFGAIAEAVDIQSFERKSFVATGDQVAVSYRTEATIKKNGNSYIDEGMQLWTFDADGKVLEFVGYSDTAAVLKAWTG